ncbi:hypothetical protein AKJ54_01110 [candidate division MSBL1 archaeon SCGC-AAA382K21]|uniref:KaiC domain-containing protein n=1 Tax=candidate division MSBL1 archaeon SCGC-AAA382K21 TaxID=1698283 RepID=A0A133VJZ4_9EURY|nr:hypothetical protein AKJ54_01110 [candidate division MSBL1 archaeon SCGC-AAA382K21]
MRSLTPDVRIKTGIPNMEKLIGGGFLKGSCNLISGDYGTGKTIFALQYLTKGITEYGELGTLISFLNDEEDLLGDAKQFGWQAKRLEEEGTLRILTSPPGMETEFGREPIESGEELMERIIEEVEDQGAERLVLDGMDEIMELFESKSEFKSRIVELRRELIKMDCTTLLLSAPELTIEGIIDSVVVLHYEGAGLDKTRALEVMKMRRSEHTDRMIPFEITDEGIIVTGAPEEREE